jgi:hypothetical protein
MSNINPQNIDGTYPIAGQDNNSQGFRDNFTNTINNFTFAAAELTDLQQNAVLKAPLGSVGQTGTPTNDMNYAFLTHAQLKGTVETKNDIGPISSGNNFEVDWETGHFQTVSITTTAGMTFANWPSSSSVWSRLRLQITATTLSNLTISGTYIENLQNIQGASGNVLTLNTGVYQFDFSSLDAGAHVWIEDALRNYDAAIDFTTLNTTTVIATGNVLSTGLSVFGNARVGLAGAVSGQFHSVVGNITQTSSGGAVYINTTGNVLAAEVVAGAVTSTGTINTTGNVLAAEVVAGAVTSTGTINTTGNVLAAGGILNALTVNGTTTRAGATVDSSYQIYKPTANVSIRANVNVSRVIVAPTPSGSISSFWTDIILPNVSTDGHTISVSSNVRIETFRVLSPWVGYTVDTGANVTLANNTPATFVFHSTENKWFRV